MSEDPIGDALRADADAARAEIRATGLICPACGINMADLPGDHVAEYTFGRFGEDAILGSQCNYGKPVDMSHTPFESWQAGQTLAFVEPGADGAMELIDIKVSPARYGPAPPGWVGCRVYWGSHGCRKQRGHEGDCECDCCDCGEHHPYPDWPDEDVHCVARAPYYGPQTHFYGEDVEARGLPR